MLGYWKLVHNGTFEGVIVLHRWACPASLSRRSRSVHELTHDNSSFCLAPRLSNQVQTKPSACHALRGVAEPPAESCSICTKSTAFFQRLRDPGLRALEPPHCAHFRHQSLWKAAPPVAGFRLWNTLMALTRAFIFTTSDTLQCTKTEEFYLSLSQHLNMYT